MPSSVKETIRHHVVVAVAFYEFLLKPVYSMIQMKIPIIIFEIRTMKKEVPLLRKVLKLNIP